jgi:hypothetical protein
MKKFYLIAISVLLAISINAADKKVMVVSALDPALSSINQNFMDYTNALDGITAEWVSMADMVTMNGNYSGYHAAIMTENGSSGSGAMSDFHKNGWTLPVVYLKTYCLDDDPNALIPGSAHITMDKTSILPEGVIELTVKDNSDILCNYDVDEVVTWTEGYNTTIGTGAGEGHVQAVDFTQSTIPDVLDNAVLLAENPHLVNIKSAPGFMWKIEENPTTKRMVVWGVHDDLLEYATADFWQIIQNAVQWVLGEDISSCAGDNIKDVTVRPYEIFPNPVLNEIHINSEISVRNVELMDITGKVVKNIQSGSNDLQLIIDTSDLVNGMYFMRVNTADENTYLNKIMK